MIEDIEEKKDILFGHTLYRGPDSLHMKPSQTAPYAFRLGVALCLQCAVIGSYPQKKVHVEPRMSKLLSPVLLLNCKN